MSNHPESAERGPFRPEQLSPGDRYELSRGHAIYCAPTGGRGARGVATGSLVIDTDPGVDEVGPVGIDAGFIPEGGTLRAPDISVGVPDEAGWVRGAPPLAIEYAGVGQDEADLQIKIGELLAAGTRLVWVVRLTGPRRVEVHARGAEVRVLGVDAELEAPGILKNKVPVRSLFDRESAHEAALRNLLQREGYESLEDALATSRAEGMTIGREAGVTAGRAVGREEGREEGRRALLLRQYRVRFGEPDEVTMRRLESLDSEGLDAVAERLIVARAPDELF